MQHATSQESLTSSTEVSTPDTTTMAPPPAFAQKKRTSKASKRREGEIAPIFLRKTFEMINTCDTDVATWSEDGSSFVVKDPENFAREVIPTFFKHSNFSSFVRQLNFYGFRKIKTDPIRIRDHENDAESKHWRFRHEKFLRGRPDLLSEIKKSNQIEPAEKQEVEALKSEVNGLQAQLAKMSKNMEELAAVVGTLMKNQQEERHHHHHTGYPIFRSVALKADRSMALPDSVSSKKRKVSALKAMPPSPVKSMSLLETPPTDVGANNVARLYPEVPDLSLPPPTPFPDNSIQLPEDLDLMDADLYAALMCLEDEDTSLPQSVTGTEIPDTTVSLPPAKSMPEENVDGQLVEQLRHSLSNLPKKLQELFVERLVTVIASPESFQTQVEAVSALAQAAAQQAKTHLEKNTLCASDDYVGNDIAKNKLATAALGSFLAQYGASRKKD
eukprot:jgi/Psemu1/610/gm1.610_g